MKHPSMLDPEIGAMASLAAALDSLPEDARMRVLAWARSRYAPAIVASGSLSDPAAASPSAPPGLTAFGSLGEFVAACSADTDPSRVLATAAFLAQRSGADSFTSAQVQAELKHLGYRVDNITRVLDGLHGQRPALIVPLKKHGNTRQARKIYKVTESGLQEVRHMLEGAAR